jgi:hypothetical protein
MPTDQYNPDNVRRLLALHSRRLDKRANVWRMLNAAYLTRFWEYVGNVPDTARWSKWNINGTEVEVNRLWRRVMTYKAALYRKTSRIECGPDPITDRGDPVIGSAVANAMWMDESSAEQMDRAVELAILFPGSGFKVGVDEGRAPALRRVWTRVVPWWELVLDSDVSDVKDERFRGHRYWAPKNLIADKYNLTGLIGSRRRDFLAQDNDVVNVQTTDNQDGDDDDGEFVEVLEFSNLVDWVTGKSGEKYKGRQEIYVLNQNDKFKEPVDRSPLAFADADGVGISHIEYLIFCHEPSFPLRGVSPCERILPQMRETNVYRTKLAELLRRNARKYFYKRGTLGDDQVTKLLDGNDQCLIAAEEAGDVDLRTLVVPVPHIPIASEFWQWMGQVQADDDQAWGQITPASGGSTERNKTAYANQIEQFWTESEIGYHGQCLTSSVKRLTRLRNRAVIHAMQSAGDAVGGHGVSANGAVPEGTDLAPIGATTGKDASTEAAMRADAAGSAGPAVSAEETAAVAVATGDAEQASARETSSGAATVVVSEFLVKDIDGNPHTVTVGALDADFEIKFVDGGRTPMADAALLQFLSTQGAQYFEWFAMVVKGGPAAVMARAWMQEVAAIAQLPPSLHVDTLERKLAEEGQTPEQAVAKELPAGAEEAPPDEQVEPAAPAPEGTAGAPADPLGMALGEIAHALKGAAEGAPEAAGPIQASMQALQGAMTAKEAGDLTGVIEALNAALDALEPLAESIPDGAAPALARAVEIMDQVRRALMKGAAAEGAPAPEEPPVEEVPPDAG